MTRVLIDMPVYAPALKALREMKDIELQVLEEPGVTLRSLPAELIQDCDIIFCSLLPENHEQMKRLRLVQISSAGYKQILGQRITERNIRACNALGVFDVTIGEWNIAMMISLARDMRRIFHNQDAHIWDRDARFQSEIHGSVVGIWGYGGIGRETARLAKALGMKVHVLGRGPVRKRENTYCVPGTGDPEGNLPDKVFLMHEKKAFLNSLDFLVMAIPQTGSTEGIVGEEELRMLPPHAFILNPARGPLVQEQALLQALREGWIAGAALDTHYYYPMPESHPLWSMPNVIMTPHISGSSSSPHFLERVWAVFVQNVGRFKNGEPLLNELSVAQLNDL
jgi:phosphoglycerate dehydrogenase-like enzyme